MPLRRRSSNGSETLRHACRPSLVLPSGGFIHTAHLCFTALPGILRRHSFSMETAIFSAAPTVHL